MTRLAAPVTFASAALLAGTSIVAANPGVVRPRALAPSIVPSAVPLVAMRGAALIPHAYVLPKRGKGTVYVSDFEADAIYGYGEKGGSPVFVASAGVSGPQGLAATKNHLYVANTSISQILVFSPPDTTPTLTINDSGGHPAGVAVYKRDAAIWVSNICDVSCASGNLQEYGPSGTLLQTVTCSNLYRYYFVAVDRAGNVAADGTDTSGAPAVAYISAGSRSCKAAAITLNVAGGVQFDDKGNLGVLDQNADTITTYAPPAYSKVIEQAMLGGGIADPVCFAFKQRGAGVWTANAGSENATEFAFPAGGDAIVTIGSLSKPIGVAVVPEERPGK